MSKVPAVILLAVAGVSVTLHSPEARVTEAQCKQMPTKNKHCHLEYGTWQRESDHVIRYIFDWGVQRCVAWHWWTDPSRCSLPVDENNFASERECLAACTGWA
ncbi:uncharacterized protein LOC134756329 [Cydia strobilella]|uniref:uncharacterized protein LOC134756329 n=1 Tax=Cydia strobilella TaxID=1100964 RepID=UPI003005BA8E